MNIEQSIRSVRVKLDFYSGLPEPPFLAEAGAVFLVRLRLRLLLLLLLLLLLYCKYFIFTGP